MKEGSLQLIHDDRRSAVPKKNFQGMEEKRPLKRTLSANAEREARRIQKEGLKKRVAGLNLTTVQRRDLQGKW